VNTEQSPNDDDLDEEPIPSNVSAVRRRANVRSKEEYCALMCLTNTEQRELIFEATYRLHKPDREPIQVFFRVRPVAAKRSL
jgi:hypothetical protein